MEYQDGQKIIYTRAYKLDILELYGYLLYVGYNSYIDSVQNKTTVADSEHPELETIFVMGAHHLLIPARLFATWAIKDDQSYADNIIRQGVDKFLKSLR